MAKHRYDSIEKPTISFYQYIDDWNDWYIELYENYPCENKEQLKYTNHSNHQYIKKIQLVLYENYPCENKEQLNKREEGEMIREIGTVNKQIAGRTYKEYVVRYSQS